MRDQIGIVHFRPSQEGEKRGKYRFRKQLEVLVECDGSLLLFQTLVGSSLLLCVSAIKRTRNHLLGIGRVSLAKVYTKRYAEGQTSD